MKFKNTPKNGLKISISLSIIILIILIIVNIIPNETDKIKYGFLIEEGKTPIWKIICYVILVILAIIEFIVNIIMCRCQQCGKYISMNIHTEYCPYCSKKLDE